ncbi:MAG: hypothetical protein CMJ18_15945 [Phycisphaeraceae bacterium]|nr:hypothetical protein [Phycisphaeraceae bacterium]
MLCLDDETLEAVRDLDRPDLRSISLSALEASCPALLDAKADRSQVEYYFTCTPALPRYVLDHEPEATTVSYVDADLYFFADPQVLFEELGSGSIYIIPHRYPPSLRDLNQFGRYNVGLLTFRNDDRGRHGLDWWQQRCLEWCYEKVEPRRYADQKYLDDWPQRFEGVVVSDNLGANLAPWNLAGHDVRRERGQVTIDGDALVFYHFHRLKLINRFLVDPGYRKYDAPANRVVRRHIYRPYLAHLRKLSQSAAARQATSGNLRLASPAKGRALLRTLLYDHNLLDVGPVSTEVHLEPLARPLLRIRERFRAAA